MSADLSAFVDTKLSKAEAIDLLISEVRADLNAQIEATKGAEKLGLTADLVPLFEGAEVEISSYSRDEYTLSVSTERIPFTKLPPVIKRSLLAGREAEEKRGAVRRQLSRLDSGRVEARTMILKTILQGTPGGRAVLEALGSLRVQVKTHLLAK